MDSLSIELSSESGIENEASGSLGKRMRKIEVNLIRGQIVKGLVGTLSVVKVKPLAKALP